MCVLFFFCRCSLQSAQATLSRAQAACASHPYHVRRPPCSEDVDVHGRRKALPCHVQSHITAYITSSSRCRPVLELFFFPTAELRRRVSLRWMSAHFCLSPFELRLLTCAAWRELHLGDFYLVHFTSDLEFFCQTGGEQLVCSLYLFAPSAVVRRRSVFVPSCLCSCITCSVWKVMLLGQ